MVEIFYENVRVARVNAKGTSLSLDYEADWTRRAGAFPVSTRMPMDASHGPDLLLPWLANLLPESHLSTIGQALGVSSADVIGLLREIGRDTAGALSIDRARTLGDRHKVVETEVDLERIIRELPMKPFLIGEEGVSMSLAGAQEKLPVCVVDGHIAVPLFGTPSTHILKPDINRLKGSVQNEAFCLTLSRLCGLDTAEVTTGRAGPRTYLLVTRYDRVKTEKGTFRIHQEDLAQALGVYPKDKYEFGGASGRTGPGLKEMFDVVSRIVSPGARLNLLDGVIFNAAICNTDAHAKNYSIMIGARGSTKFAPFYDLLCGDVWPTVTKLLPQAIAGRRNAADLQGSDWIELAKQVGLNPSRTLKRARELIALASDKAPEARDIVAAMPGGPHQILDQCVHSVQKRSKRLLRQLDNVGKAVVHAEPDAERGRSGMDAQANALGDEEPEIMLRM